MLWISVEIVRKHPKEWREGAWGCWAMTHSEWATSPLAGLNEEMEFKSIIHFILLLHNQNL